MRQIQAPQLLSDLYRDLRDRRLLFPVIALAVAIVAVPVLLGGSEPVAAPAPAPLASDEGIAVESAVLVEQSGIRNYSKRLAVLKKKNPFEQKFVLPEGGETATGEDAAAGADPIIPADAASSGESADALGSPSALPTGSSGVSTPEADLAAPETSEVPETVESTEPAPPEIRFYAGRVDVSMGPIGEGEEYEDVRYLSFLPNDKAPVVAYLGLVGGGDRAIFSISSDVEMGEGSGSCAPKKPAPCQFLTLKVGEERYMSYGTGGETYRLKLLDTQIVRVPDPRQPDDG